MEVRQAEMSESAVVHKLMEEAFLEYRDETPPFKIKVVTMKKALH